MLLVLMLLLSGIALISCSLIDDEKTDPNRITFPSFQKIYTQGNKNTYSVRVTLSGSGQSSLFGSLTMDWDNASLAHPLQSSASQILVVKFKTVETIGSSVVTATQYITQSILGATDQGSILVHAFDTNIPLSSTKNWVEIGGSLISLGNIQSLYSPYQPAGADMLPNDIANAGEKGRVRAYNFDIMGGCVLDNACFNLGTVTSSTFTVVDRPLRITSTALGDFETYEVSYAMTLSPNGTGFDSVIDFRLGCASIDFEKIVTVSGNMFVNPDIGLILMTNTCNNAGNGSTTSIYELTNTNYSFK